MGRFAPDHTAKRHEPMIIRLSRSDADGRRNFQRARHLDHIQRRAGLLCGVTHPLQQRVRDILVVGRDHRQQPNRLFEAWQIKLMVLGVRCHALSPLE